MLEVVDISTRRTLASMTSVTSTASTAGPICLPAKVCGSPREYRRAAWMVALALHAPRVLGTDRRLGELADSLQGTSRRPSTAQRPR